MAFLIGNNGVIGFGFGNDPWVYYPVSWTLDFRQDLVSFRKWNAQGPIGSNDDGGNPLPGYIPGDHEWSGSWSALVTDENTTDGGSEPGFLRFSIGNGSIAVPFYLEDSKRHWAGVACVEAASYALGMERVNVVEGRFVGASILEQWLL